MNGSFLEKLYYLQQKQPTHEPNKSKIKKVITIKVTTSPLVNRLMTRRRKKRFTSVRPHPLAVHLRKIYTNK
jgi:hypothetical protein